jgi:hypothetical protein
MTMSKKILKFIGVSILVMSLNGGAKLQFYTDVYAWYPDGKNVRQVTKGPFQDERPCFNPDGKEIAFVSNRLGKKNGLWRVSVDGAEGTVHHGHATRGKNGLITFDALRFQRTASTVEPPRTVDRSFHYVIKKPAYPEGSGPVVLIDEAHNNFHTAAGTYQPFAGLLRQDGYVVERAKDKISGELLSSGAIYVIADAQPPFDSGDPPTFSGKEIQVLNDWVKNAGALFIITDHMPDPGAIADLALTFGIEVSDGYAMEGPPPGNPGPALFQKKNGSLADHFLTRGRGPDEQVDRVATFAGSAFRCEGEFQPLLIFGEGFRSWILKEYYKFPPGTPSIDVSGWYQGGVMRYGKGKIAFFAEAAMFTAQVFADGRVKAGMNHPLGRDNARLLLNILHWLSGDTGTSHRVPPDNSFL